MKEMRRILLVLFIIFLWHFSFGNAQISDNFLPNGTEETIRDLRDTDFGNFSESAKGFLLEKKLISGLDRFFQKINFMFIFLFSRDYSFSLEMFLVFILWVLTWIVLYNYARSFFEEEWFLFLFSLGGTIALAWLQIYNIVGRGLVNLIYYRDEGIWPVVAILIIILFFFIYLYVNRIISRKIMVNKKKNDTIEIKSEVEKQKRFRESFEEALAD